MNTTTFAARSGRIAAHVWVALRWFWAQLDWELIGDILLRGIVTFAVIVYLLGKGLGTLVHRLNDALAGCNVERADAPIKRTAAKLQQGIRLLSPAPAPLALLAPAPEPAEADELPQVPAPPAVQPLYTELAHLPVSKLRTLAGTRSKRHRRHELLAMVAV